MRIALDRRSDYAVRALIFLARVDGDGRRKAREIARVMDTPEGYLPQVLSPLIQAGIVRATAGRSGGYELAKPPAEITLLEVIECTEGPLTEEHCLLEGGPCDWDRVCPLHPIWVRAHEALRRELQQTTFDELARNDKAIEHGGFEMAGLVPHPNSVERKGRRDG